MNAKIKFFLLFLIGFNQINSFELITSFDDITDANSLNNFTYSLQKNIDHFLINKIHIFYKKTHGKLPAIFKNSKVNLMPVDDTPYFSALVDYANDALEGQSVIIARPNTYFDDTLFKLNYYPMINEFLCLNDAANYSCWIFNADTNVSVPKQIKFNDQNLDNIVANSAHNTPGVKVLNPALDLNAYQYNSAPNTHPANLVAEHLTPFVLDWNLVRNGAKILLYAKNMHCDNPSYCTPAQNPNCYKFACLSPNKHNSTHFIFDFTQKLPLDDNSVDVYLAEDVFEHVDYNALPAIINEIYRVLKPGGFCRISMPDYRCDLLYNRSIKDKNGKILFDPQGGGQFVDGKVINGGHLWFPQLENTTALIKKTKFFTYGKINFLHYYDAKNVSITKPIDYSVCYVRRTPDNDGRVQHPYRVMSIVVDLFKQSTGSSILTSLWPFKEDEHEKI